MKRIHVLHVSLFLKMGGLESIIMDLAKHIDKSRFKISILCLASFDAEYKKVLDEIGVTLYHIKREGRYDYAFFTKIIKLLNSEHIDILHAHSGCVFNSAICSKLSSVNAFVYTEHGLPMNDYGIPFNASLKARLEDKIAARISGKIFAVSQEICDDMKRRFPASIKKVDIVTNGVNTEKYKPVADEAYKKNVKDKFGIDDGKTLIGSVGRLVPIKNYESLIKACSILIHKVGQKIHLILIGDGVEREKLVACAKDSNISQHVTFAGVQYNIHTLLPALDTFVLPSWTEGTSISLLESQSCGVPAVVSKVGGNPSIISDGVNGFLFDAGDSQEMADKLKALIDDHDLRVRMGQAARSFVEQNYSVRKMVKEYEQNYSSLMRP